MTTTPANSGSTPVSPPAPADANAPEFVHHGEGHHSHKHMHDPHHHHHHRHHHAGGETPHTHGVDHALHADNPGHAEHHN